MGGSTRPRLLLLACGSFSPPTPMHLRMFELTRDYFNALNNYTVIGGVVSPVHDAYGKKDLVSASHRCTMLNLALRTSNWIKISDWEVNQEGWTKTRQVLKYHQYTVRKSFSSNLINLRQDFKYKDYVNEYLMSARNGNLTEPPPSWIPDTILNKSSNNIDEIDAALRNYYPNNGNEGEIYGNDIRVMLLCGADLLESFATPGLWDNDDLEAILGGHGIVVISRSGSNPEKFIYDSDILNKYRRNITIITNWVPNEVSSTMVRRLLRRGESVKYLIDDSIIAYIKMHKLYGCGEQNIKYLTTYNPLQPFITTPSPNDIIMKSPSEFRMQKDDLIKPPRNTNISTKIMNYLIGVDETDNNEIYTSNNSSGSHLHYKEKRSRLTSKVSSINDLTPKIFCGDNDPGSSDSMENLHILPRKSVKVITDVSGVHKIVNNNKKVCGNTLDITEDVYVYLNAKVINSEYERAKQKPDSKLSIDIGKLKIDEDATGNTETAVDSPKSPLRSYDEVVKFIFSEHGIQVISDRETVV